MKLVLARLKEARALLERPYGWTQRRYERGTGRGYSAYCASGAVDAAVTNHAKSFERRWRNQGLVLKELKETLHASGQCGRLECSIESWNDEPGRKKREVLDLFDRTIERLENS